MIEEDYEYTSDYDQPVRPEQWSRLYTLAGKVGDLAPWRWMNEMDIFGVTIPGWNEPGFVSVMGELGEHRAVAVYRDASELSALLEFARAVDHLPYAKDWLPSIHQVQAAFGPRKDLMAEDREVIRSLGLSFRGPAAWPRFRSYRPGYFPWRVDAEEAEILIVALEQTLEMAPRVRENPALLGEPRPTEAPGMLVRARPAPDAPWRDEWRLCPPIPRNLQVRVPAELMNAIRSLPPSPAVFQVDAFPLPTPIRERDERPRWPQGLMVVDQDTSFILAFETLIVDRRREDLWVKALPGTLEAVRKGRRKPQAIQVRTPWLHMILHGACEAVGIRVDFTPNLEVLEDARQELEAMLRRTKPF